MAAGGALPAELDRNRRGSSVPDKDSAVAAAAYEEPVCRAAERSYTVDAFAGLVARKHARGVIGT